MSSDKSNDHRSAKAHIGGPFTIQINRPLTAQERDAPHAYHPLSLDARVIYASARSALRSLLVKNSAKLGIQRIFVPSYTCPKFLDNILDMDLSYEDEYSALTPRNSSSGKKMRPVQIIRYHHTPLDNADASITNLSKLTGRPITEYAAAAVCSQNGLSNSSGAQPYNLNLTEHDVILFNDFFGIQDLDFQRLVELTPAIKIHDLTQAAFNVSTVEECFSLYSPRKFLGIPDGGILSTSSNKLAGSVDAPHHVHFQLGTTECHDNYEFCNWALEYLCGAVNHRDRYAAYRNAEVLIPEDACQPPTDVSLNILFTLNGGNIDDMEIQRKQNFLILQQYLPEYSVYTAISARSTPLGFPVFVKFPLATQTRMAAYGIYCPRHWDFEDQEMLRKDVFCDITTHEIAMDISKHILTLPCDQRYRLDDMMKVVRVFKQVQKDLKDEEQLQK